MGVLTQHLTEPPPPVPAAVLDRIGAPRELAAVIARALAKDREHRYQTIDELANAVRVACGEAAIAPGGSAALAAAAGAGASSSLSAAASSASSSPLPATPAPAAVAPSGRVRTRWTGKLAVPAADEPPPPRRRSKLPLIAGAIALAGAAAAVTVVVRRGGGDGGQDAAEGPYIKERRDASSYMSDTGSGTPATGSPPGSDGSAAAAAAAGATAATTVGATAAGTAGGGAASGPGHGDAELAASRLDREGPDQRRRVRPDAADVPGHAGAQAAAVPADPARVRRRPDRARAGPRRDRAHGDAREARRRRSDGRQTHRRQARRPGVPQIKPPPPAPAEDDCPELPCLKADPTRKGGTAAAGGNDGS
ncbi:MAG TPA: hypothetical protein VK932_26780 [Kofleriaceae bacterium]|nr:hypothetical protein [Kofleriaceae bacterium]